MRSLLARALAVVASVLPVGLVPAALPSSARAVEDPVFVGWSALLPPGPDRYQPNSADECAAGMPGCVRRTLADMAVRFRPLADVCDHNAVFSLAYLRTTQAYAVAAAEDGFFQDAAFVNHEDAVFAKYYFRAFDAWSSGDRGQVPPAWRIALDAARDRSVSGSGNLLLGMNAHVNADLPFVLAAIGLVRPDGSSRKPDHDAVNVFLNRVVAPLLDEEAARFDPGMDDAKTPYGLSYTTLLQILVGWREAAWRNAEQLLAAPDEPTRARVAQRIQDDAEAGARTLALTYAYHPPMTSAASRDAYCAARSR